MNNGAYPTKWNSHQPPLVPPVLNSMEPQLPIQAGLLKSHRDSLHPHNKQKPPDYYQYPAFPRQPYPPAMQYAHSLYDMSGYHMGPQGMQRRVPADWSGQWGGQDMTPLIDPIPQQEAAWSNDWGHHLYPGQMYPNPYRMYQMPQREQMDPQQLKQSLSPVPPSLGGHTMNSPTFQGALSPMRTHQAPRSNISQTNSEFPAYSPNPQSTSHLSPPPVPHTLSHTPTSSLPDLNREVSKESCHSNPHTPFRHPSMELNNLSREDSPMLSRQQTPTSHLGINAPPNLSAPKRGPNRKKLDSSLPFEQWVQEHGLYPQLQKELGREGKDFYLKLLQYLYEAQGGPYASPARVPLVGKDEVNLFRLYRLVESNGGVKQLCERKEWKKVFQAFNYQSKGSTGIKSLKQVYSKWLLPFICHIKGEPIEPAMEMCRSSTRPRKQQNCQSDTLSVTSPTPLSEESQEVPESPASFHSSMSTSCSPSKLSRDKVTPCATLEDKERATSSDIKPFLSEPEDPSHLSQPFAKPAFSDTLSSLDQSSPPFHPNKSKPHPATHPMEVLKPPKIKQEQLLDGTDTHHTPYPYFPSMYPHMQHDPYHLMGPRHPYPRLMPQLMAPQRWPSPIKEEWSYMHPRPPQPPDAQRTQSATPETKPRAQREKPPPPPSEVAEKPPVSHKRMAEVARPGHVELTTPIMRKRKKQPPDLTMTDPFTLTMALRSGVLSDTAWALDYLTILLNHNGTRELYHLEKAQGLLDALVACWLRCLLDMFPGELSTPDHPIELEPVPELTEDTGDLPPPMQIVAHEQPAHSGGGLPHSLCHLKTPFSAKGTQSGPSRKETPAEPPGVEEEVLRPLDNVVFLHATHETQLGSMAICISNLIRCLSFIPGNELVLSTHDPLLALIGQLLLLKHTHPRALSLPTRTHDTTDTPEDTQEDTPEDTPDGYVLDSNRCEWWWVYIEYVREDIFVILCNMAGALDFSLYPSSVTQHLLSGLLHWLICPSSVCQDPLPRLSNTTWLSPKRLVLECLSKLSVLPANVDYLLATPTHELGELIRELSRWSINKKDIIARQFVFMLLYNLCGTQDMCPQYVIARQTPILQVLMECVELPPPTQPPQTQRATKAATFQEEVGVLCALRRRAAGTLFRLSLHPENHSLFIEFQPRLLALVCPARDTPDTFKGDTHLRQLVLETISHLCKD